MLDMLRAKRAGVEVVQMVHRDLAELIYLGSLSESPEVNIQFIVPEVRVVGLIDAKPDGIAARDVANVSEGEKVLECLHLVAGDKYSVVPLFSGRVHFLLERLGSMCNDISANAKLRLSAPDDEREDGRDSKEGAHVSY